MESKSAASNKDYPVIYDYFPELRGNIGWTPLGSFPTPVHQLKNLNHDNLWIKRDDKTSPDYGGNKVRKLEFILADAVKRKKTCIVTMGGIGTNHGLATAIYSKKLGLECSLLLLDQPLTQYVQQNLLLFHRYGAEMVYVKGMFNLIMNFYIIMRIKKRKTYFLYAGGSTPIGALGFVNAVFELKKQIKQGLLTEPNYIICPLGSNGTLAGLSLGVLLAGLNSTVIGVRVAYSHIGPIQIATPDTAKSLMEKTYLLLKENSTSIPDVEITAPMVLNDYFGDGYGYPTREGMEALELFMEKENIKLEPTYTAKTCAALLDFIKDPTHTNDNILYWHTFNSVDLSGEAAAVDYHELPQEFHSFF